MPNGDVKDALIALVKNAEGNIDKLREQIEHWFDFSMDRVTGWYKRKMQWVTFIVGLIICVAFHVNTFTVVSHLAHDNKSREKVVQMANEYVAHNPPSVKTNAFDSTSDSADTLMKRIDSLRKVAYQQITFLNDESDIMGIGWNYAWNHSYSEKWNNSKSWFCSVFLFLGDFLLNLPGILLTTLALLLGAPFWFDMLQKVINIRNSGKKPQ